MSNANHSIPDSLPKKSPGPEVLQRCDVCGGARQLRLTLGNASWTVACNCSCGEQQLQQRREALRRQEELDRIARLRTAGIADPKLRRQTFASSEYHTRMLQIARNYVHQWPHMEARSQGLLFWGPCGTGKTYAAACIANALTDQGIPVLMSSLGQLLGALPGISSGQQTEIIHNWMQHSLLVIDDLGSERDTPYASDLVYQIIDARYRSGKPLIVTTNLTLEELENPGSRDRERIYQRVLERCTPVFSNEQPIRDIRKKENLEYGRKWLTQQDAG